MKITRLVSAMLVLCVLLGCLYGCNDGSPAEETTAVTNETPLTVVDERVIKLPYSRGDGLDPYNAVSQTNLQLAALVFDSLFTVTEDYSPRPLIASDFIITGTDLTVNLLDSLVFSDGSTLTSEDVVYSYERAKESDIYSERLGNFSDISAVSTYAVSFSLKRNDPYAVNCLDFPVVKSGSVPEYGEDESIELSLDKTPIGSGRYVLKKTDTGFSLVCNDNRLGGYIPKIKTIVLVELSDSSALKSGLEIGEYDFAFDDLSSGSYVRINAGTSNVILNNLVFLGFNSSKSTLANADMRRIISMAIDREDLTDSSYQGFAVKTAAPFNPRWEKMSGTGIISAQRKDEAVTLRESAFGDRTAEFNLLVNADNRSKVSVAEHIADQLAELNITITVNALEFEEYATAVESGDYDIYLGEMRLTRNMNLSPLLDGDLSDSMLTSDTCAEGYNSFLSGETAMNDFLTLFDSELPFVPLFYRMGVASCARTLSMTLKSCEGDVFCDIQNWVY